MLKKLPKYVALGAPALILATVFGLFALRAIEQYKGKQQRRIQSATGIDLLEQVRLGGLAQSIRVRGKDSKLPLLLFLDGGPGVAEMAFASANSELEKHFIVVHWDQRGAGKSFNPAIPPASMNVARLEVVSKMSES